MTSNDASPKAHCAGLQPGRQIGEHILTALQRAIARLTPQVGTSPEPLEEGSGLVRPAACGRGGSASGFGEGEEDGQAAGSESQGSRS